MTGNAAPTPPLASWSVPSPGETARKKARGRRWIVLLALLGALLGLAFITCVVAFSVYYLPTGAMAETLRGEHYNMTCWNCGCPYALGGDRGVDYRLRGIYCPNCGAATKEIPRVSARGDRILCNEVLYDFKTPNRWDPCVFRNPTVSPGDNPPKTIYIKRLVGLPNEKLEIIRGDIVVDGTIRRKPAETQERLWMRVYDINYPWKEGSAWKLAEKRWSLRENVLVADCPAGTDIFWAEFKVREEREGDETFRGIFDHYGYNPGRGLNVVTDLRISFDVNAAGGGRLFLSLAADTGDDLAVLDLTGPGNVSIRHSGKPVGDGVGVPQLKAAGAGVHRVSFCRVDYLLELAIDGKIVVQYDLWNEQEYRRLVAEAGSEKGLSGYHAGGVKVGASNAKFDLANLRIDRDIYYTCPNQLSLCGNHYYRFDVPEDSYFSLGDNSPCSLDSRYWGKVPGRNLIGKAFLVWWPPSRIRFVH